MFDQATSMGDGVSEERSPLCGKSATSCTERLRDKGSRADLECSLRGHSIKDIPVTSTSSPGSSKEETQDTQSAGEADYCRRILVRGKDLTREGGTKRREWDGREGREMNGGLREMGERKHTTLSFRLRGGLCFSLLCTNRF